MDTEMQEDYIEVDDVEARLEIDIQNEEIEIKDEFEMKREEIYIKEENIDIENAFKFDEENLINPELENLGVINLRRFSTMTKGKKLEVIRQGRPTPDLKDLNQRKGITFRLFKPSWYAKKEWLCGCTVANKLFCFPCLLFSYDENVWINTGYSDLNNLPAALSKHERSAGHYESQLALKTFDTHSNDTMIEEQNKISNELHNKKVKKNRDILQRLINATCFLIKQELAFRGNDESSSSLNRGNYVELIKLISDYDEKLSQHLQSSSVFSGLSSKIQNDLIESIGIAIKNDIKEDISNAPFVAVEVDEITDSTGKSHSSMILRYVIKSEVKEAFIGFDDVSIDRTAKSISQCILKNMEKYNCTGKLVAQSYDGASVISSHLDGVQAKVKESAPAAIFTHCYAHKLTLVLWQSTKLIPECAVFFKTMEGFSTFFRKSMKHIKLLEGVVNKSMLRAAPFKWISLSKLVQNILHHYRDFRNLFQDMRGNHVGWDCDSLVMGQGFDSWLAQASTYFMLMIFDEIFNKTDALFKILQTKLMNIGFCMRRIRETIKLLDQMNQDFDGFYQKFEEKREEIHLTESQALSKTALKEERKRIYSLVLTNVNEHMEARYRDFINLQFLSLVDGKQFQDMAEDFDFVALRSLEKTYSQFFDFVRLKADLLGMYNAEVLQNKSVKEIIAFILKNGLKETFPEALKLLQLVLTMPVTAVGRKISALKRIEIFIQNQIEKGRFSSQSRFSSLSLISIEKERLSKLQQRIKPDFYETVTDLFLQKDRRLELIYK